MTPLRTPSRSSPLVLALAACLALVMAAVLPGCRSKRGADEAGGVAATTEPATTSVRATTPTLPRVVALGDSVTAGLGLLSEQAYPARLQHYLDQEGYQVEVINAGVSGDTSAAGLRRLDWALEGDVRVLILALGANDGLRGLPVEEMQKNLAAIIETARARQISVLLAGMEAPPNFGADYTAQFRQAFRDLAVKYRLTFMPFLLDGVAGIPALNQEDGIHPTRQGAQIIADHIWPLLKPMVDATVQSPMS